MTDINNSEISYISAGLMAILILIMSPAYSHGGSNTAKAGEDEIVVAISNWAPRKIIEGDDISGIDPDILKEVARRLNMKIRFLTCTWRRCQEEVKNGRADFITSASRTAEREKFYHFIEPPYATNSAICLYTRKGSNVRIRTYTDMYKYRIASVRGSILFDRFDKDERIDKVIVSGNALTLKLLIEKRVDAFIDTEMIGDYAVKKAGYEDMIGKAAYKYHTETDPAHMALSRKSRHVHLIPEFSRIMKALIDEGMIETIRARYGLKQ